MPHSYLRVRVRRSFSHRGAFSALACFALLTLGTACDKVPEQPSGPPKTASTSTTSSTGAPGMTATPQSMNATWTEPPASWEKAANPGPMRRATYHVKGATPEDGDAEVSVSQAGGTVFENVQRWAKQMAGSDKSLKQTERTVGAYKITTVEMFGAYSGMAPPGSAAIPRPETMFIGSIVELGGGQSIFFKMIGSKAMTTAARPEFDKMVESVKG